MQADLSEYPEEAALLLAPIESGHADMVIGTRTKGTASPVPCSAPGVRQLGRDRLIRMLYGFRYSDLVRFAQSGGTRSKDCKCRSETTVGRLRCRFEQSRRACR